MPTTGTTAARGYGHQHQQERQRWAPTVAAGKADCAELVCLNPAGRWIEPGQDWDLAHDRVNGGYLGPAHSPCNRSEGAKHGNGQRSAPVTGTPSDAW